MWIHTCIYSHAFTNFAILDFIVTSFEWISSFLLSLLPNFNKIKQTNRLYWGHWRNTLSHSKDEVLRRTFLLEKLQNTEKKKPFLFFAIKMFLAKFKGSPLGPFYDTHMHSVKNISSRSPLCGFLLHVCLYMGLVMFIVNILYKYINSMYAQSNTILINNKKYLPYCWNTLTSCSSIYRIKIICHPK